ncbi:MAG: LuxR C-terminal-related transcriptional regulator [Oscillospiraceae bacterium]|nr:LuxR C-terminal-related transcriptional regulator [Oscillospiraceae bacterium]MCD8390034.1 LuxR C-terminal-related transcriptional regulator [Oscillospiraceae bacterium]
MEKDQIQADAVGCPLMPLLNSAFAPGHCLQTVQAMKDPKQQDIAMGEYYYFSGRAEEAARQMKPYLTSEETALRLSACLVYAFANLATDNIQLARSALTELQGTFASLNGDETAQPEMKAISAFFSTTAAVLLHLPPERKVTFSPKITMLLPPGLRFFFCYVQAHHAYLQGEYGRSLGIAETALAFQPQVYPIPSIYLRLVAVMDYMSLKQPEQAKEQMLLAWDLARPDGLIEAFGEHHGLLGGILETTLKKDWPEDFRRIISITYDFSAGWRKVHNPNSEHNVADNLTTTEFAVAMLAARNWTYQEIADHMGISLNTVKAHIKSVLSKLGITKKSELAKYMLR